MRECSDQGCSLQNLFDFELSFDLAPFCSATLAKRKEQLQELLKSNSYKREAHREKDSARENEKHNKKTKTNQNGVLDRYIL
jgi:hypothetical protein